MIIVYPGKKEWRIKLVRKELINKWKLTNNNKEE